MKRNNNETRLFSQPCLASCLLLWCVSRSTCVHALTRQVALASAVYPPDDVFYENDVTITYTDPNVTPLTMPSAANGKVLGFNYGNVRVV